VVRVTLILYNCLLVTSKREEHAWLKSYATHSQMINETNNMNGQYIKYKRRSGSEVPVQISQRRSQRSIDARTKRIDGKLYRVHGVN